MKNLFLYAKYLAHQRKSNILEVVDLQIAARDMAEFILDVDKKNIDKLIERFLEVDLWKVVIYKENDNKKVLESIKIAKKMQDLPYSFDVRQIVLILNDFDISIDGNLISLKKKEKEIEKSSDLIDPLTNAIELKKFLSSKIYGQDMAINAVVDSVKNKVVDSTNMPAHIFVFLGPPATGKTYFSQLIGEYFEDYSYLELNMQQFSGDKDGMNLYGSESNYSTSTPGRLTQAVKNDPKTVVVLDEFEKAHTNIQKKLLTIFSEGHLEDMNGWLKEEVNEWEMDLDGRTPQRNDIPYNSSDEDHKKNISKIIRKVDFTQTIFMITSNLGSTLYNNHEFLDCLKTDYDKAEVMIMQSLQKEQKKEVDSDVPAIIPEMLSRLSQGKIVLFNKLDFDDLFKIAKNSFDEKLIQFLKHNRHIKFESNGKLVEFLKCLLLKFTPFMDIRRIKSKFYENFSDKISDYLLDNEMTWKDINSIDINLSKNVLEFLEKQINPKIENKLLLKHFFRKNLTLDIKFDVRIDKDIEIKEVNDEMSLINKKTIFCNIEQVSITKVNKIEDMLGDGAISFEVPDVSFDDIAGHEDVKNRLKEIANFLKYPEKLEKFKAKIPKGMLLYGIPGTGKTMLAKAFANYADVPFIETTANELMDLNANGVSFMKEVFRKARDYSPSIIFIDEIDSFGSRSKGSGKVMINELLTQINGFSDDNSIEESVFIIAATNFKDDIDEAILRPGRIELHVEIPTLDIKGREYFINKILEKPCEKNISVSKLIMYSAGMTGAQLEKVSNESSLYALRHGLEKISEEIILEQINIEKYGNRITGKPIEEMLEQTAYHEAGHAVISKILNPDMKIEQITVAAREDSLGFVSYDSESLNTNPSKKIFENKICIAFAGRIAQIKKFDDKGLDTGASNDLAYATRLAYLMVTHFGMDEEMGYINLNGIKDKDLYKEKIEKRVGDILNNLKTQTEELVNTHWKKIEKLAKELLKKEVIHEEELNKIVLLKKTI